MRLKDSDAQYKIGIIYGLQKQKSSTGFEASVAEPHHVTQ